jgi:hypothetical protein
MRANINPSALYWASFNRFELRLPGQCVIDCSHSGPCDDDVAYWLGAEWEGTIRKPRLEIPETITPEKLRAELQEYGAWEACELEDHDTNLARLVWIAACNIAEDDCPDCGEPVND